MNYVVLSEVAKIIMGQSPPSSTYNAKGEGLPFFQGKADFGEIYPTPRIYCSEPNRIAEPGDILITVRAPVGPINLNRERSCIGRGLSAIRVGTGLIRNYLFYFLRYYEPELAKAGTGSTFAAISREDLETIKLPLPSLHEQQRIAAILQKADRLRHLRRYACRLSETYLQSVFLEMFGDPKSNPKGWKKVKLGDLVRSVQDGPHVSPKYYDDGIPFLSTRNIRPGEVIWEDMKYISLCDAEIFWKRSGSKPEIGDILFTKGGTTGFAKTVDFDRQVAVWVHIAVLKIKRDLVVPVWLEHMLNTNYCYQQSQELTFGIVNRDLGLNRMIRIDLYLPPISDQERFAQIASCHDRLRLQERESERQMDHLFQSLLQRAFMSEPELEG